MLGYKISKFRKIEIISSILLWQQYMKSDVSYEKKTGKNQNMEIKQHATE